MQWSRSNPLVLHHISAPAELAKVTSATVTQKFDSEKVDQLPDHSSRAPYCCRSRRCSCSAIALSQVTPLSTTPGRFELSWGTQRSASCAVTMDRSPLAICRSCCSGSWTADEAVVGSATGRVVVGV